MPRFRSGLWILIKILSRNLGLGRPGDEAKCECMASSSVGSRVEPVSGRTVFCSPQNALEQQLLCRFETEVQHETNFSPPLPSPPPPPLPPTGVHSPTHALQSLRLVKSSSEIALMRKAGEITATAFRNVSWSYSLAPRLNSLLPM